MDNRSDETIEEIQEQIPKKKKHGKVKFAVLSILLAVVTFFAGALTFWFVLDPDMRSLIKLKFMIDREYYEELSDEEFYGVIFNAVNEQALDAYSSYMTADEYTAANGELAGNRSGVGIVFRIQDEAGNPQLFIVRVCGNSPAEEAGLQEGDEVLGFGKVQTEIPDNTSFEKFSEFLAECADNETFYLRVKKAGEERVLALYKSAYTESSVFYRTSTAAYGFSGKNAENLTEKGEPLPVLDGDTAYIRLTQFGNRAVKEFDKAMALFKEQNKKHLVLDLRGNGGGYMDVMQKIAKYFCKNSTAKEPIAAIADCGKKREKFKAAGNIYYEYFSADSRICVLADSATASASEALIGCMVDYGATRYQDICLSERSGVAKTYGKGIMQATYTLSDDCSITLTVSKFSSLSGESHHGVGITPDVVVDKVADQLTEAYNAAYDLIK